MADLFDEDTRHRIGAVVTELETKTAAEVVVLVRRSSATYRDADYLFGAIVSMAFLLAMLFLPTPFALWLFPVGVAVGFFAGAALNPARRLLTSERTRRENVGRAARDAFVSSGVARCTDRLGILVYVSGFEDRVEVVCDLGVDQHALGHAALLIRPRDLLPGLQRLGEALSRVHPRTAADQNELTDTPPEAA